MRELALMLRVYVDARGVLIIPLVYVGKNRKMTY